jgi:hypothetical protein
MATVALNLLLSLQDHPLATTRGSLKFPLVSMNPQQLIWLLNGVTAQSPHHLPLPPSTADTVLRTLILPLLRRSKERQLKLKFMARELSMFVPMMGISRRLRNILWRLHEELREEGPGDRNLFRCMGGSIFLLLLPLLLAQRGELLPPLPLGDTPPPPPPLMSTNSGSQPHPSPP